MIDKIVIPKNNLIWKLSIVILTLSASLSISLSGLIYPSPFSPLFVGLLPAMVVVLITWLRKPAWSLYAALFCVLLPAGLLPSQLHSQLNRLTTIAAFGFWLVFLLVKHERILWNATASWMTAFILWGLITFYWTLDFGTSTTILQVYILRMILFLILVPNFIRSRKELDGMMNVLAINGWVLVISSLFFIFTTGYTPGTRLQLGDVNENAEGVVLLVTMIGVLWKATQPTKHPNFFIKIISGIFIFLTIVIVAMSGSRGSAISLVLTLLLFLLWKSTRPWGILGLLILVFAGLMAPFMFTTLVDRFLLSGGDTMLGGREALWQASWQLIQDHLWGGVGIGNASYALTPYLRTLRSILGRESAAIHNPILVIWAETGIPGIISYLGVLVSAIFLFTREYLRAAKKNNFEIPVYYALIIAVFAGYILSWIKGGGVEKDHLYFFMLSLLFLPLNFGKEL